MRLAHVCLVPDLFQFDMMNGRVSDIGGLPVIHIVDETPYEFKRGIKRTIDIVFSGLFLVLLSPPSDRDCCCREAIVKWTCVLSSDTYGSQREAVFDVQIQIDASGHREGVGGCMGKKR